MNVSRFIVFTNALPLSYTVHSGYKAHMVIKCTSAIRCKGYPIHGEV